MVGQLRIHWSKTRLYLRYRLPRTTLFAEGLLGDTQWRQPRWIETVVLRSSDGNGQDEAFWRATLEIAGFLRTRQVERDETRHELGRIRLMGEEMR